MKKIYYLYGSLLVVFLLIMFLVITNNTASFDSYVYSIVTNNITDTKTTIYKIITFFGSTAFIVGLVVFFLVLFIILKNKKNGLYIAGALITSTLVNNIIKVIVARERPDVTRFVTENTYSFPSGHAMASTMMYGMLIYLIIKSNMNKNLKIFLSSILCLVTISVGISRIYLGAHFVTDILAGMVLSGFLLAIIIEFIENYNKKNNA